MIGRRTLCLLLLLVAAPVVYETTGSGLESLVSTALCVPTTALALYLTLRLAGPYWWWVGTAFLWGALPAGLLAGDINSALGHWSLEQLNPDSSLSAFSALEAAVVEEGLKVLPVAALVWNRRWDRAAVLAAMLAGFASGVGFNFSEAVGDMASAAGAGDWGGLFNQFLGRQIVGLLIGHPSYTALAGAGVGFLLGRRPMVNRWVAGFGLLGAALASHYAWDLWGANLPTGEAVGGFFASAGESLAVDGVSFVLAAVLFVQVARLLAAPQPPPAPAREVL